MQTMEEQTNSKKIQSNPKWQQQHNNCKFFGEHNYNSFQLFYYIYKPKTTKTKSRNKFV
jgi:hypothetical protein